MFWPADIDIAYRRQSLYFLVFGFCDNTFSPVSLQYSGEMNSLGFRSRNESPGPLWAVELEEDRVLAYKLPAELEVERRELLVYKLLSELEDEQGGRQVQGIGPEETSALVGRGRSDIIIFPYTAHCFPCSEYELQIPCFQYNCGITPIHSRKGGTGMIRTSPGCPIYLTELQKDEQATAGGICRMGTPV